MHWDRRGRPNHWGPWNPSGVLPAGVPYGTSTPACRKNVKSSRITARSFTSKLLCRGSDDGQVLINPCRRVDRILPVGILISHTVFQIHHALVPKRLDRLAGLGIQSIHSIRYGIDDARPERAIARPVRNPAVPSGPTQTGRREFPDPHTRVRVNRDRSFRNREVHKDGVAQPDVLARWAANAPLAFVDQYLGKLKTPILELVVQGKLDSSGCRRQNRMIES